MSLILCIETSTEVCSVALAREGRLAGVVESVSGRDHARLLAPYVERLLRESEIAAGELAAVAVSGGPGSYTGLRIGVSLAKGMCYALNIPLIGVGSLRSLCAMAREQIAALPPDARLCPMIDARRMEVYAQVFDARGEALTEVSAEVVDGDSFAPFRQTVPLYIFGDGAEKCREALSWAVYADVKPSAAGMTALAAEAFAAGRFEDTAYYEPHYLKDFVIKPSAKKLL